MLSILGVVSLSVHAAEIVGSDYAGADLVPADGDQLVGTFTNVGTFQVPAGTHVRVRRGVPLVVEADMVLIEGHLDGDEAGFEGGAFVSGGLGPGGGTGSAGGGYGGVGGHSGGILGPVQCGGNDPGGQSYGSHDDGLDAPMGSGGGGMCGEDGDDTTGGSGGGSITLRAPTISVALGGQVTVNGGRGGDNPGCSGSCCYIAGGNGGGSGGSLVLDATVTLAVEGDLSTGGGAGGNGSAGYEDEAPAGGGGAGGRIKLYGPVTGNMSTPNVIGGQGGIGQGVVGGNRTCSHGERGGRGTLYVDALVTGPPTVVTSGVCGAVTITVSGGTPYGHLDLITGTPGGSDPLSGGVCAGVPTGLSGLTRLATRPLDESGSRTQPGTGPDCGTPLQVVDLWSCTTSPVVTLP